MTDFVCSVCYRSKALSLTQVQGTIICTNCLDKAKNAEEQNILKAVGELVKENDIYD